MYLLKRQKPNFLTFLNFFVCYGNKAESHFARNFHEFGVARSEELDVI